MGNRLSNQRKISVRYVLIGIVACLLLVVLGVGFLAGTNLQPALRVIGPSMSPTLWGPSRILTCRQCEWTTRTLEAGELSPRAPICFRCGSREHTELGTRIAGDQVRIDPYAYLLGSPRIGDLVAIEMTTGGLQVKRVVGRPGDVVAIDLTGRVTVNGQAWRLPLLGLHRQPAKPGIEVYNHDQTLTENSRLNDCGNWLIYHHRNVHNRGLPDTILDDNPANLRLSRTLYPVDHLYLELIVDCDSNCRLDVVAKLGDKPRAAKLELYPGRQRVLLELDGQNWKLWEGKVAAEPLSFTTFKSETCKISSQQPLAIRFEDGVNVRLESFWIGRGVRFDPPGELADRWRRGIKVPAGHLFVLGDNGPASLDSRHQPQGIELSRVAGRVSR